MDNEALRAEAARIFKVGVAAADPVVAVRRALTVEPVKGRPVVIALGKAAGAMMEETLRHVNAKAALVITNAENAREIPGASVIIGEHPVPGD